MATSCHPLLGYNNTIEKDDDTVPSSFSLLQHHHRRRQRHTAIVFFFSNTNKTKHTRKQQPKKPREWRELTFKLSLCLLTFGSRFYLFVSNTFSWHLLLLKQKEKKKNIEMKKNVEKGGSLPSSSCSAFSLLAPASTFLFQTLSPGIVFFSSRRKKKKT
jgi:hypothetical protein